MRGLRFHAMLVLTPDCILLHGGRSFKTKPSDSVNGFLYACLVEDGKPNWYPVPFLEECIPRFGHKLVFNGSDLYVVGGFSSSQDKRVSASQKISFQISQLSTQANTDFVFTSSQDKPISAPRKISFQAAWK